MSCNYAESLSHYDDKGICGLPEIHDESSEVDVKIERLAEMVRKSRHTVIHTGAGISTAAGIPDFRGPKGVWTLEKNGVKPEVSVSFKDAIPTATHMALVTLEQANYVHFVVSQNVDGLYLKSGFPSHKLVEPHGNMFLDKCNHCQRLFIRKDETPTVGQKCSGIVCLLPKPNGRRCRGKLCDTVLDWEDELPERELEFADYHARKADLSICLGTTLQIVPCGNLPLLTKKAGGKIVICNLQKTKHDKHADMIIHDYVDVVMKKLLKLLGLELVEYKASKDPTKCIGDIPVEYVTAPIEITVIKKEDIEITNDISLELKPVGYHSDQKRPKCEV